MNNITNSHQKFALFKNDITNYHKKIVSLKNHLKDYQEKVVYLINSNTSFQTKVVSLTNNLTSCQDKSILLKHENKIRKTNCKETSSASFVLLIILLGINGVFILFKYRNKIFGCQKIDVESIRLLLTNDSL